MRSIGHIESMPMILSARVHGAARATKAPSRHVFVHAPRLQFPLSPEPAFRTTRSQTFRLYTAADRPELPSGRVRSAPAGLSRPSYSPDCIATRHPDPW